jgi:hypothetical protein
MARPLTTLRGSLSQLQRAVAKIYSQLQQRFEGNYLVSSVWAAMDHDLQVQVESLKKLPPSFWQSLKNQEKELARAAELVHPANADWRSGSLRSCLTRTIDLEEPIILKVYAPFIRRLRSEWTEHALDFYVMVKAHIARVAHSIQLFSGDPSLSLRCAVLLHSFEKEVQEPPEVEVARSIRKKSAKKSAPAKPKTKKAALRRAQASAEKRPIGTLDKIKKHAKPMVQKIKLAPRRARR